MTPHPTYSADWATDDVRRALADARRRDPTGDWARLLESELRRRIALGLAPADTLVRAGLEAAQEVRHGEQ